MMHNKVPGIYVAEQQYTLNPLQIDTRCLTAFVGICERGTLNTPILIKSFDKFLQYFGNFNTAGILPFAVYNFFKCGGSECIIVRIAHTKDAHKANIELPCDGGGAVTISAENEGNWGNYMSARVWHETEKISDIYDADFEDGEWIEFDISDIKTGDQIQFSLIGRTAIFRTVKKIHENRVYFDEPVKLFLRVKKSIEAIKAEKVFFSISIFCRTRKESYQHLSMNPDSDRYFVTYINERSKMCTVTETETNRMILPVFQASASGGKDGIAELSPSDFIGHYSGLVDYSGIGCFESRSDISLIAAPDLNWLMQSPGKTIDERLADVFAVQNALVSQAERFPGRFAILDIPDTFDVMGAIGWRKKIDSSFAAAYYPFIDVLDPLDPIGAKTVRVPPSGSVCGCIVATDNEKGIFHAPANCVLQGAVGISNRVTEGEHEMLYSVGINVLKYFPGKGIKIWGVRTLSSDPNWRYINVRRTFSQISASLKIGTQWAVFEVNDSKLRKRLVRQISGFLLDLWMKGYLAGSTSEQGFFVSCSEELNPPQNIDAGILTFEIGLAITKPTEFFNITITAEKDGASVYINE